MQVVCLRIHRLSEAVDEIELESLDGLAGGKALVYLPVLKPHGYEEGRRYTLAVTPVENKT